MIRLSIDRLVLSGLCADDAPLFRAAFAAELERLLRLTGTALREPSRSWLAATPAHGARAAGVSAARALVEGLRP